MVVWCLYDDCEGSWNKLKLNNVFSLGINDNDWDNYFKIDLSLNNENLINDLKKIEKITGKPDVIVAHPPCESWSKADNQRRLYRTHYLQSYDNYLTMDLFTKNFYIKNNLLNKSLKKFNLCRNFHKKLQQFLNGVSTIGSIDLIIEIYKPKIFIMENPLSSKLFKFCEDFLDWKFYYYKFYYNNFDENYTPKPTFFISNVDLNLEDYKPIYQPNGNIISFPRKTYGRIKGRKCTENYSERSSIPQKLLMYIYEKIKNKMEVQHEW